ncbi:MAG TPA: MBL fold metallo-hydrolase [Solirubrobacteraceae bacterium]|jgi:glyoxylase-like metal-dependent hydrolase (beta-lactamase superfamily II)
MRAIDLEHRGIPRVIAAWEVDGVIVDPGPESCVETLLAALGDEPPRAILLTHIHFDHAGATGALLRRWPDVPVYVHERGARHMIDPERLVASATRLYGEEGFKELWGEVTPVPEAAIHALSGGETLLDGAYRVAYTPGHASHHVSYLHEPTGRAFVGDVAGVTIPPSAHVMAPTPPPDLDVAAWERSLDTVAAWRPTGLALTHFGPVEAVEHQLDGMRAALAGEVALAGEHDLEGFVAAMEEQLRRSAGSVAETYIRAAPLDHLWLGIDRWRSKTRSHG